MQEKAWGGMEGKMLCVSGDTTTTTTTSTTTPYPLHIPELLNTLSMGTIPLEVPLVPLI